ncbi:MAG: cupin domain-containing protein [Algicola sp.]|nr:cupin domain-containing protein [Algicola sp.]
MKVQFLVMTALLLGVNCGAEAGDQIEDSAHDSAQGKSKQLFLSEVKMPVDKDNIHVVKLGSDQHSSDFLVFVRKNVPPHKHVTHSESVYVIEGTGIFELNGKKINIGPGHYVKIPQGVVHSVTVTSDIPLKALSVQAPEFFGKDRVPVKN